MSELKSIRSADLQVGKLIMKVHVLSDGKRIIEEQSMIEFMEYMGSGELTSDIAENFVKELHSV